MRGDVVIDLGELGEVDDGDAKVTEPRPKWRPPAWVSSALVVLGLLTVVAGSPPRPHLVRVVGFPGVELGFRLVDGGVLRQDGDEMFFLGTDGRERWRILWHQSANQFQTASAGGGRLLLRVASAGDDLKTVALDLATGEKLWQLDGWVHEIGDVLMLWDESVMQIYSFDAGRLLWESARHRAIQPDFQAGSMFVLDREQRLTEHDLRTGHVRRSRQLALPVEPDQVHLEVRSDYVLVAAHTPTGEQRELFHLDRSTLAPTEPPAERWHHRYGCGAVDCVLQYGGGIGGGVIDRTSGRLLWSVREGEVALPWEAGAVMVAGYSEWAGEMRVLDLVDPVTRRSLADVAGWTLLAGQDGVSIPPAGISKIALFRAEGRPTLVAHMDARGPRVLGLVPAKADDCRYLAPLLLCRETISTIGVWRVDT